MVSILYPAPFPTGVETWPAKILLMGDDASKKGTLVPPGLEYADLKPRTITRGVNGILSSRTSPQLLCTAQEPETNPTHIYAAQKYEQEHDMHLNGDHLSDGSHSSAESACHLTSILPLMSPHLDWPALLALRGVSRPLLAAVDDHLSVPELVIETRPPEHPAELRVYARVGGVERLLPFFCGGATPTAVHTLQSAKVVWLSGRMHPVVNRLLEHLPETATVHLDLLTGTALCPLRVPSVRRLALDEEQVSAWASLGLGAYVVHAAREVEVRVPLSRESGGIDWRFGPMLRPSGFTALLQPSTERLLLSGRGRVAAFLDAVGLLFPPPDGTAAAAAGSNLRVSVALSTREWWDRVQPNGAIARRTAAAVGVRADRVSVRLEDAGTLGRWVRMTADAERQREIAREEEESKGAEAESREEELEDWEVDGDWFK